MEIVFATAKIGALAIPLDVKWKALELVSVVAALEPRFIILQEDCVDEFAKAKELKDLSSIKAISLSADLSYSGLLDGQSADEPEVRGQRRRSVCRFAYFGYHGFSQRLPGDAADVCLSLHQQRHRKGAWRSRQGDFVVADLFQRRAVVYPGDYLLRRHDDFARAL